jgi:hypothetical protein
MSKPTTPAPLWKSSLLAEDLAQQDARHVAAVVAHRDDVDAHLEVGAASPNVSKPLRVAPAPGGGQAGPPVDERVDAQFQQADAVEVRVLGHLEGDAVDVVVELRVLQGHVELVEVVQQRAVLRLVPLQVVAELLEVEPGTAL